eukprot:TRINITY_DN22722_c0_g1_i1.p2 TRINITY_DN22722_c0_g1~~TRINITY_DN22722_c0_g1_i1.p2  ORF type:complete len:151 (+),score=12.40 TRINITY_DN22722_c0_g1_i1:504-956(+)
MGQYLRPKCEELVGVDLSSQMIEQAKSRKIYDDLIVDDICVYLSQCNSQDFGVVCAADVFVYIGDLYVCVRESSRVLQNEGYFLFSTERGQCGDDTYLLQQTGRYCHGNGYIKKQVVGEGFQVVEVMESSIRYNNGKPVQGSLFLLQKQR